MGAPILHHVNGSEESNSVRLRWDKVEEIVVQHRTWGNDHVIAGVEHEGFAPEAVQQYANPH